MDKPTYKPTEDTLQKLAFRGKNEAWETALHVLDTFIEIEVANAIRPNLSDADRAHACGRADSLADLKNHLSEMRSEAQRRYNIPDVE
jgi:hypothetical protein